MYLCFHFYLQRRIEDIDLRVMQIILLIRRYNEKNIQLMYGIEN